MQHPWKTLALALALTQGAAHLSAAVASSASAVPDRAPEKLSDIYRIFTQATRQAFGAPDLQCSHIRVLGRSRERLRAALFPEVELTVKPFDAQGLRFEKVDLLFRHLSVDPKALQAWQLKMQDVREVQSRLVFTLRSLAQKLGAQAGQEIKLRADLDAQQLLLSGQGRFLFIPCTVEARCQPVWDETARTLRLTPLQQSFGGHRIPAWLWWLGRSPVPPTPVLDLGPSWIPYNIQEVHVGWDRVNLSTNW